MSELGDLPTAPLRPTPKAPFLPNDRFRIRRVGKTDDVGVTVYAFFDVIEELLYASNYLPNQASAGVLTGGYYLGPAGEFVEIRGFRDSVLIESTLAFADTLKRDWERLRTDLTLVEAGLRPIGWFLSQPGCAGQLGPFEHIVHGSYFNLPFQLLLLLDPVKRLTGLYLNGADGRLRNVGFNIIESVPAEPTPIDPEDKDRGHHSTEGT